MRHSSKFLYGLTENARTGRGKRMPECNERTVDRDKRAAHTGRQPDRLITIWHCNFSGRDSRAIRGEWPTPDSRGIALYVL